MGSVMAVAGNNGDFSDELIDETDAALVNWELHLPDDKKDVLSGGGEIDEPLFHAHIIFNVYVLSPFRSVLYTILSIKIFHLTLTEPKSFFTDHARDLFIVLQRISPNVLHRRHLLKCRFRNVGHSGFRRRRRWTVLIEL